MAPSPVDEARAIHGPSDLGVKGQPAAAMLPAVGEPPASWRGHRIRADAALPIRREDGCDAPVTAERDADVRRHLNGARADDQPVMSFATPAQGRVAEYGGWHLRELGKVMHPFPACGRGRRGMCWRKKSSVRTRASPSRQQAHREQIRRRPDHSALASQMRTRLSRSSAAP